MLTVLIATLNRSAILKSVLETHCQLEPPSGGWKLVIVDNGSQDNTKEIVEGFRDRLPVQYVREDQAGKSHALNTGLRHAEGDLIVFTDDDILLPRDWLSLYRKAAGDHPDYDIFAGPIRPKWPFPLPEWLAANGDILTACFGASPRQLPTGPLENLQFFVYGGNFCLRTNVFRDGYRFDEQAGFTGPMKGTMGEETILLRQLSEASHRCWYLSDAAVEHIIRPEQLHKRWILTRAKQHGRGFYRLGAANQPPPKMLFGVPRFSIRQIGEQWVRTALAFLSGDSRKFFRNRWQLQYYMGYAIEGRRIFRSGSQ